MKWWAVCIFLVSHSSGGCVISVPRQTQQNKEHAQLIFRCLTQIWKQVKFHQILVRSWHICFRNVLIKPASIVLIFYHQKTLMRTNEEGWGRPGKQLNTISLSRPEEIINTVVCVHQENLRAIVNVFSLFLTVWSVMHHLTVDRVCFYMNELLSHQYSAHAAL